MIVDFLAPLAGGGLIGLSASLLLLLNGRIAGISGIIGGVLRRPDTRLAHDLAFIAGLLLAPPGYLLLFGGPPPVLISAGLPLLIAARLLVGFGSRLGSGCTSGHGVVGLARLSPRSLVAVLCFLGTGALTVYLKRIGGML